MIKHDLTHLYRMSLNISMSSVVPWMLCPMDALSHVECGPIDALSLVECGPVDDLSLVKCGPIPSPRLCLMVSKNLFNL
jgi:hypothetical protein